MTNDYIWLITDEVTVADAQYSEGSRDWNLGSSPYETLPQRTPQRTSKDGGIVTTAEPRRVAVSAEKLEQGLTDFLQVTGRVLRHALESAGDVAGMELEAIELTVEVNGEGQVSLMGSGIKTGGKGAMTLKFKKASPPLSPESP